MKTQHHNRTLLSVSIVFIAVTLYQFPAYSSSAKAKGSPPPTATKSANTAASAPGTPVFIQGWPAVAADPNATTKNNTVVQWQFSSTDPNRNTGGTQWYVFADGQTSDKIVFTSTVNSVGNTVNGATNGTPISLADGSHDLYVELCNQSSCSWSQPLTIRVGANQNVIPGPPSPSVYNANNVDLSQNPYLITSWGFNPTFGTGNTAQQWLLWVDSQPSSSSDISGARYKSTTFTTNQAYAQQGATTASSQLDVSDLSAGSHYVVLQLCNKGDDGVLRCIVANQKSFNVTGVSTKSPNPTSLTITSMTLTASRTADVQLEADWSSSSGANTKGTYWKLTDDYNGTQSIFTNSTFLVNTNQQQTTHFTAQLSGAGDHTLTAYLCNGTPGVGNACSTQKDSRVLHLDPLPTPGTPKITDVSATNKNGKIETLTWSVAATDGSNPVGGNSWQLRDTTSPTDTSDSTLVASYTIATNDPGTSASVSNVPISNGNHYLFIHLCNADNACQDGPTQFVTTSGAITAPHVTIVNDTPFPLVLQNNRNDLNNRYQYACCKPNSNCEDDPLYTQPQLIAIDDGNKQKDGGPTNTPTYCKMVIEPKTDDPNHPTGNTQYVYATPNHQFMPIYLVGSNIYYFWYSITFDANGKATCTVGDGYNSTKATSPLVTNGTPGSAPSVVVYDPAQSTPEKQFGEMLVGGTVDKDASGNCSVIHITNRPYNWSSSSDISPFLPKNPSIYSDLAFVGFNLTALENSTTTDDAIQGGSSDGGSTQCKDQDGCNVWEAWLPNLGSAQYYLWQGANTVRIPINWNALTPTADVSTVNDPQHPLTHAEKMYLQLIAVDVQMFLKNGVNVILDLHNYMRYQKNAPLLDGFVQGNYLKPVTATQLAAVWTLLANQLYPIAQEYNGQDPYKPQLIFSLMNEPHDMATDDVRNNSQAAIDAIRSARGADNSGASKLTNLILVSGNYWTGLHSWVSRKDSSDKKSNADVFIDRAIKDDNYAIDVHEYFDYDGSGNHPQCQSLADFKTYVNLGDSQTTGGFIYWMQKNHMRVFVGEMGSGPTSVSGGAADDNCKQDLDYLMQQIHQYPYNPSDPGNGGFIGWAAWYSGYWSNAAANNRLDAMSIQNPTNCNPNTPACNRFNNVPPFRESSQMTDVYKNYLMKATP